MRILALINTTTMTTTSTPTDADAFKLALGGANLYVTPAIIVVGVVGNTLSLVVFSATYNRRQSSAIYLSALSVADVGFLAGLLVVWLERVDVFLFRRDDVWCRSVIYAMHSCAFLSAWTVVAFTVERYVTVHRPPTLLGGGRGDAFNARRRARRVVAALVAVAASMYASTVWTYDVIRFDGGDEYVGGGSGGSGGSGDGDEPTAASSTAEAVCGPLPQYRTAVGVMTGVDTLVACVVPSSLIVVLNARIFVMIHRYQRRHQHLRCSRRHADDVNGNGRNGTVIRRRGVPVDEGATSVEDNIRMKRLVLMQTSVSASGSVRIKFRSPSPLPLQSLSLPQLPLPRGGGGATMTTVVDQRMIPGNGTGGRKADTSSASMARPRKKKHAAGRALPPEHVKRIVRARLHFRTARMLLIFSSVSVLMNLPTHAFRVEALVEKLLSGAGLFDETEAAATAASSSAAALTPDASTAESHRIKLLWQELFQLIYFLQFAMNFFIYCACAIQFRNGLVGLAARFRRTLERCVVVVHDFCLRRRSRL